MADEEAVATSPVTDEQTPEQTPPKLSVSEFAARIKAKYPAYANLDDNELTQKMLAKYPQYKNQVDLNPEKKSPDQTTPPSQDSSSAAPTGGQDSGNGSLNIPGFNQPNTGLGYIKNPSFQDQWATSWQNEDARKKNMQDTLHGYVASGNSDPATVLSLAKTAKKEETPNPFYFLSPESLKQSGEYLTNHVFIPLYKTVVGGVDTLGAGVVDFLSDVVDKTTPFNVADNPVRKYFDEAAAGASNIAPIGATKGNDGAIGSFLEDLSSAGGTVAMAALTPASTANTLATQADVLLTTTLEQAGAKSVANRVMLKAATAPITKLFAAQGATGAYNTSSIAGGSFGENLSAGIEGGIKGVGEGIKLETQMAVGNSFGTKLANKLAEKGLLVGGKPTAALINATMAGTVFGGTSAATDIANGNPIDYDAAARQAALGIAFGVPEIAGEINKSVKDNKATKASNEDIAKVGLMTQNLQDLNHQAIINNLMGFQPEEIQAINRSKASADDLYAQSLEVGSQAYDEKDPDQKKVLQQQQLSLKNQGDVKRATETIIKNPNEFLDGVLQSDLPVENKIDLMNKATIINKGFNPIELHKQEIQNQITDLDNQVKLIDVQQTANPQDGQSKAEVFTLKDNLVQERERLVLNLLDITDKQSKGLSAAGAINTIEANRQTDLNKVGPLPHNVIENQSKGTHDVISNGDILSQHPTPEEAHQRAEDLNRPQIKAIDEINNKYNKQRAPFDAAAETGLIEPPTGKKVTDNIPPPETPEKVFDLNTPEGKIKVEPISENELAITTESGKTEKYSVKEAVDAFEIKPEDIKKIADNYVESEKSIHSNDGKIANDGVGAERNADIGTQSGEPAGEIPSEATPKQNEEPNTSQETVTKGTGENAPVEKPVLEKIGEAFQKRFGTKFKVISSEEAENILSNNHSKNLFFQILDDVDVFNSKNPEESKNFINKVFHTVENAAEAKSAYRKLAVKFHPDKGGHVEVMKYLNEVKEKYDAGKLSTSSGSGPDVNRDRYNDFTKATEDFVKNHGVKNAQEFSEFQTKNREKQQKKQDIINKRDESIRKFTQEIADYQKQLKINRDAELAKIEKGNGFFSKKVSDQEKAVQRREVLKRYADSHNESVDHYKKGIDRIHGLAFEAIQRVDKQYAHDFRFQKNGNQNTGGFYDKDTNTAYLIHGVSNDTTAIHEMFSHPFISAIEQEHPELFANLLKEAKSDQQVLDHVGENYNSADEKTKEHEYIAAAIDLEAKNQLKNKTLIGYINEFWNTVKEKISSVLGIKDFDKNTTISDLVKFVLNSDKELDLSGKDNAAQSGPPAETTNPTENGEIKTNEAQGRQEGVLKEEQAQEQTPEPVKASGESLDVPALKDSGYNLAATEIPSGKNKGKFGIFETNSGKLISNLYDTNEELLTNFEKNKDRLTPEAIKSKIVVQNVTEGIRSLKVKNRAYESTLGLPVYAWNNTLELIARSIEGGAKLVEAIQQGVNHIKQNYLVKASDKEIEDAVRNAVLQKPKRNEGEEHHDFAKRVLAWKKGISSNEELSAAYKNEATKSAAPEARFNNQVKAGTELLRKNLALPIEEFNKALGVPEKDTEYYIAAIKQLIDSDSIKKINAEKIMQSLREQNPKKVFATEASLLKRSLRDREQAAGQGYRQAKAETKQAFLEYDAAKKTETKEKIAELQAKHETALEKEKQARINQKEQLTGIYKNIRGQIHDILSGLNKSKLLAGVDYSSRELISFANKLNGVVTEKGIDKFRDFVNKVIDHADYSKDITATKGAIGEAKRLLNQDYVPQNIKSLLKDITTLNPERVEDVKELRGILENLNESLTKGVVPENTESDLANYIGRQREFDTQTRRSDILDKQQDITSQDEFQTHAQNGNTNFVHKDTLADITNKIIKDDNTTHNEKVKKLNEIDDALDLYRKDLNNSIDENGNINGTPPNFLDTLEKVKEGTEIEPTESHRDTLENVAIAKQDQIDPNAADLSPEQRKSLEILQKVPLKGQDANTLRLFNNVVENVVDNDNHSGITILEAKAVANSEEGALKPVKYLESIGKETIRSVKGANKVLEKVRELRSVGENISALLTRFANNDFKFLSAVTTGTNFDQIQNGFATADHRFQELVAKKVEKLFKQYPDIAKNPEAIQRLSLFSFINQYREFASPDQQNREIQKRVNTINKDIALKEKGLDAEKGEAEIEKKIWGEFAEKIKEKTGIDITDKEQVPGLKYSDIEGIDFLKEGEKKIYDTYREADDTLRPEHEQVAIGINKPYETWANHMRDNYRFLGSGLVDVIGTDNLGFQATDNNVDSASDSMTQRVKGDPLAQKSGERQKVLNLNFFDGQNQSIKNILNDIHTLKDRMTFDEAMKNKEFQDAIGNENHQFYKDAASAYVLNEMGLNKSAGEKELKLIKKGLNVITKLGTYKQLLSMTAYVKQATSTIVNTLAYTGFDAKTIYEANQVMGTSAVEELLKKHPISRRAENNANLNILSQEGIGDKSNIVSPEGKSAVAHTANAIGDFINKYFLHLEKNGTTTEPFITKPIKFGDVKTAEWSWITLYGKELVDSGKYPDFKSIDWEKEAATPDREAAARAEQVTSKQLNENTKAGRSKLINSSSFGYQAAKAVLFPFGSFNMHKGQVMVENLRTLTSKDTYVNKDSFKEQGGEAIKSILSNLVEESCFQGLKIGIGLSLVPMLQKGLIYTLGSLFGTKEETEKYLDAVDLKTDKKAQTALNTWFTQTVGNQVFGALGNTPQDQAQKLINYLSKKAGSGDIFYEPKLNISQELQQAQGAGMISAAFSGDKDRMRDLYRIIDNKNKFGVPVDISPMQKSIIAASVLSDVLAMAGMNDADLNRSIETMRKNVDNELAAKFHDPYYTDESAPRPISIDGKKVLLSEEHQDYYEQEKARLEAQYTKAGYPKTLASQAAAENAKLNLLQKFHSENIVKEGKEIKKKK